MNFFSVAVALGMTLLYFIVIPFSGAPISLIPLAVVIVLYIRRGFAPAFITALLVGLYEDFHRLHLGPYILLYGLLVFILSRVDRLFPLLRHWQRVFLLTGISTFFYFFASVVLNVLLYGPFRSLQPEVLQSGILIILATSVIPLAVEGIRPYKKNERYK